MPEGPNKNPGHNPPQDQEVGPRSRPYLLVDITDVTFALEECEPGVVGGSLCLAEHIDIADVTFAFEECEPEPGVAGGSLCLATQIDDAIKYRLQP